jgi:hypothetical protein
MTVIAGLRPAAQQLWDLRDWVAGWFKSPSDTSHTPVNTGQITLSVARFGAPMVPRSGHADTKLLSLLGRP